MSADGIAYSIQDEAGWTDTTLLILCLTYIDNQKDNGAFEDFLRDILDEDRQATSEME